MCKYLEVFKPFGRLYCLVGLVLLLGFFARLTKKALSELLFRQFKTMVDGYSWVEKDDGIEFFLFIFC